MRIVKKEIKNDVWHQVLEQVISQTEEWIRLRTQQQITDPTWNRFGHSVRYKIGEQLYNTHEIT